MRLLLWLVAHRRLDPDPVVMHLGVVVLVVEHPHQPGVGDRDVVALEVVVGDDLPVGRLLAGAGRERLERARAGSARAGSGGRRRSSASGVASGSRLTNSEAAQLLDPDRQQPELRLLEPIAERESLGDADQRAVELVGPAVVAAADRALALAGAASAAATRDGGRRCGRRAARPGRRGGPAPAGCRRARSGSCRAAGRSPTCPASCQVRSKISRCSASAIAGSV